jgi:hypothetical protein
MAKYDLAISFAGEQRKIAESFARRLDSSGYSIFYDEFEQAALWGQDLTIKLGEVYSNEARFCLILVSNEYIKKAWTNIERQNALSRMMNTRSDYILCLKIDEVSLPGLPSVIGYLSLATLGESKIYKILLQKLGPPNHDNLISNLSSSDKAIAQKIIQLCYRRAVFTRMASEIDMRAMYNSLNEIIGEVQKLIPTISDQALQYNALEILGALDSILRVSMYSDAGVSNHLDKNLAFEIDKQKVHIIASLLEIRRAIDLPIQLPFALQVDHFWGNESANEPPKVLDAYYDPYISSYKDQIEASKDISMPFIGDMSPIGAICSSLHDDLSRGAQNPNYFYEEEIMKLIRSDLYKGFVDDPLAKLHLGNKLRGLPDESLTKGPKGEEVKYFGVRCFPSGKIVGLFGVWPGRSSNLYAVVVDEKFPDFFGFYFRSMEDFKFAETELDNLKRFETLRNEEQGKALVENGWVQLVPQRQM